MTKAHSIERQELLSKAKTHGALFCATGGGHITSDDFFKSMEMPVREAEIKAMEKDKARRLALAKYEDEARMILESEEKQDPRKLKDDELRTLLLWHQVPKKDIGTKPQKLAKWTQLAGKKPPVFARWLEEDESKLSKLKEKRIDINDTALGRLVAVRTKEQEAAFKTLKKSEREDQLNRLKLLHEMAEEAEKEAIKKERISGDFGGDEVCGDLDKTTEEVGSSKEEEVKMAAV